MQPDHVLVRLTCNARREELTLCVRVNVACPSRFAARRPAAALPVAPLRSAKTALQVFREIDFLVGSTSSFATVGPTT